MKENVSVDDRITIEEAGRILEIPIEADEAEIRSAYLTKVKQYPPERSPEEFQRVRQAYDLFRDPRERGRLRWLRLNFDAPFQGLLQEHGPKRKHLGPLAWLEAMGTK